MPPSKEEQEAAKNTFACLLAGERLVIRFDAGEARLLMPDGDRVALYQIPAASGVRFTNGNMELRGKGMDLQLVHNGVATPLNDCQPFVRARSSGPMTAPCPPRRRHRHRRHGRRRRAKPRARRRCDVGARHPARSAGARGRATARRRRASPADLARACDVIILLVVDAEQVETRAVRRPTA